MRNALHPHHIIFTPENPKHPSVHGQNPSIEDVTKFLNSQGEDAQIIEGFYDGPERSILVQSPKNINGIHQMAKDFGQDSLLHSMDGNHTLHYLNGPQAGQKVTGKGTQFLKEKPDNYYSTIHTADGPVHFQHNLDFPEPTQKSELKKAPLRYEDYDDYSPVSGNFEDSESYRKVKERKLPNGLLYRQYVHASALPHYHGRVHTLYDPTGNHQLGYMSTQHQEDPMADGGYHPHQVNWAEIAPEYRGKGLGRQMYLAALVHGAKQLTSDSRISPEAQKAWKSFRGLPGIGGKIAQYPGPKMDFSKNPGLASAYENDRHQLFIRDPAQLDHNKMFPAVDLHGDKLASSEIMKSEVSSLDRLREILETPAEDDSIDIPEHLQIQWSTPIHRWNK